MNRIIIDEANEKKCKEKLQSYLSSQGQKNVDKNVNELFDLEAGFVGRFDYFVPYITEKAKKKLLISGGATGSELIVAKKYGFEEIHGTEVTKVLVDIANERVKNYDNIFNQLYNGEDLPYPDNYFTTIYSGHIIEHTKSPYKYFKEHLRVLNDGGFFFIEFPNRYHKIELHTNLPSFEWMPKFLRFLALKFMSSKLSPDKEKKHYYKHLIKNLEPMSIWQIRLFLILSGNSKSKVMNIQHPAPGFVRMLIRK